MGWIVIVTLFAAAFLIVRRFAVEPTRKGAREKRARGRDIEIADATEMERIASVVSSASLWITIIVILASTFGFGFHVVKAGHVGVVYEFGSIKGQIREGPNWIAPWRSVEIANTQVQSHKFEKMACFSQETQAVYIDCTLNTRISERAVQKLYREVGPDWFDKLVLPRVPQYFKDETVKFLAVDIAPNREEIRHAVSRRMNEELSVWSIETPDLLLNNIDFEPGFKQAIENKQIATQNSLEEAQKVNIATQKANQQIETAKGNAQAAIENARGEGEALLAVAEKQAEANRKLAASITPELIRYQMVDKLNPNVTVMMTPGDQGLILDSSILNGGK